MDQYYNISREQDSGLVSFIKKSGIAKTTTQANVVLTIIAIICLVGAAAILWNQLAGKPAVYNVPETVKKSLQQSAATKL